MHWDHVTGVALRNSNSSIEIGIGRNIPKDDGKGNPDGVESTVGIFSARIGTVPQAVLVD